MVWCSYCAKNIPRPDNVDGKMWGSLCFELFTSADYWAVFYSSMSVIYEKATFFFIDRQVSGFIYLFAFYFVFAV